MGPARGAGHYMSVAAAVLLMSCSGALGATRYYVDASRSYSGSGGSWGSAFKTLGEALDRVGGGSYEIWVADGVYKPGSGRTSVFDLPSNVAIYGGFAGNENSLDQRDWAANQAILSGDIGVEGKASDNCYHVLQSLGSTNVLLDGLIVTGGNADGTSYPTDSGGGLLIDGGQISIINCTFRDNFATSGGGINSDNSEPYVDGCQFLTNRAELEGGGWNAADGGTLLNTVFAGNLAPFGGAFSVCCGPGDVNNCTFIGNMGDFGGAIFSPIGSLDVCNSRFVRNAGVDGGAIHSNVSAANMINCSFQGNFAQRGGAYYSLKSFTMINCTIARNFTTSWGGGIYSSSNPVFINNTFYGNVSLGFGGGLYNSNGTPTIQNTIFWDNTDADGQGQDSQLRKGFGNFAISYSCVMNRSTLSGTGLISSSPKFADMRGEDNIVGTADDVIMLLAGSPCVDSGQTSFLPPDSHDIDNDGNFTEPLPLDLAGLPRVQDGNDDLIAKVDMGAYELNGASNVTLPGDANNDLHVDMLDLGMVLGSFNTPGPFGDVTNDGWVNQSDLNMVLGNFAQSAK